MNKKTIKTMSNPSKVLLAVAAGEDLTKLELRERTSLSMSTVISSVDALVKRNLITFEERKGERGGKPHSVINAHPHRRVYGVSYKSGVLTATAVDLKGCSRESLSQEVEEGASLTQSVLSLLLALQERAPDPLTMAVSINCEEKVALLKGLEDRFGVPAISCTNTTAVAYLALWKGAELPVAALGIGAGVKCAVIEGEGRRNINLGGLPSSPLVTGEGTFRAALCSSAVEETLRRSRYRGQYVLNEGYLAEINDLGEYSRALAKTIVSLAGLIRVTLSPARTVLFGEYLSEAFFERIVKESPESDLTFFQADRPAFALGTALCALKEGVFN